MYKDLNHCEQMSALMDGELEGEALADALRFAQEDDVLATWEIYHLVGDVLRSPELAAGAHSPLLGKLREQLAQEPSHVREASNLVSEMPVAPAQVEVPAANASVFRWKMVAGVASMAAVAAIGWSSLDTLRNGGSQLAAAPAAGAAPVVAVSEGAGQPVMLRDPRLDELLQAHKQFGSTSALQMPAGFLRNATFEEPSR